MSQIPQRKVESLSNDKQGEKNEWGKRDSTQSPRPAQGKES